MSLPAKRQHEETAAAVKLEARPQQHVGGTSGMVMEFGGAESRPAKVARHNDHEKVEHFSISAYTKPVREEVVPGGEAGNVSKLEAPVVRNKVREIGSGADGVKGDRVDLGRVDSKDHGDVAKSSNEVLGRVVDVRREEQLQSGASGGLAAAQEFDRAEGNVEGSRRRSPRDGEGKSVAKREDVAPVEGKREEVKEKEKKDERRVERKEDAAPVQQQPPHSDGIKIEKEVEKEEVERDKGEKVRERERERSRDREKEALVRSEKREKRDKERERDRDRREEREDMAVVKLEKADGRGMPEVEMDSKPVREVEERKVVEKEGRERAREREREKEKDEEGEGEKRKKRGREHEREREASNAMDTDGGGGEKDKDKDAGHGHSVQQRKRALRNRGQPNPANRDSRSRFRPKGNEGTQGRSESTTITYRVGVGMPELAKLRKEYVESGERNSSANGSGPTVEIHIPADHATTTNRQIRGSQLWGTDIYTGDSDIVAVLMHTGYFSPSASPPPTTIVELRATIRILESQKMYTSTLRNSLRSRSFGGGSGCSYSVERCRIMKQGGGSVELEPCSSRNPQVAPTLAPAASERTVTTRAASSSAYRQQRFMQEVTIQYNLCNEPWPKYHMSIVADRGLKKSQFTSARLKKGEALYVETHVRRYELSYEGERTTCNGATTASSSVPPGSSGTEKGKEKWGSTERALAVCEKDAGLHTNNGEKAHGNQPSNGQAGGHHGQTGVHHNGEVHECYRWSRCKRPLSLSSMRDKGVPLPEEYVEVLEEGLGWDEVQWAPQSVWIRGTEYVLTRAQFLAFERDDSKE